MEWCKYNYYKSVFTYWIFFRKISRRNSHIVYCSICFGQGRGRKRISCFACERGISPGTFCNDTSYLF
ncbi:hypothetical protein MUY_002891 [Bacillus licheniformis WX-02]|nr:hypothetical protein MUY_002891 [Bacillus licheniformis WX-02]